MYLILFLCFLLQSAKAGKRPNPNDTALSSGKRHRLATDGDASIESMDDEDEWENPSSRRPSNDNEITA
jgi:hypothetical protein